MLVSKKEFQSLTNYLIMTSENDPLTIYNQWRETNNIDVHSEEKYILLMDYITKMKSINSSILKELVNF